MDESLAKEEYAKILEHQRLHKDLHSKLDVLVADYIRHTNKSLTETHILDLMVWSYSQTVNPV